MKRITFILVVALMSISFVSCDKDDNDSNWDIVPTEVRDAFTTKYPAAKNVEWENKGNYKVADFSHNNVETLAWFDTKGTWYMTEKDINYNSLPQLIKDSFGTSAYSTWKVEDVDMLERKDSETVYIIEVEQQDKEMDLYYSTEGILIKDIANTDNKDSENHIPQPITADIEAFIKKQYPESRIIEVEKENNRTEVDIIHNNIGKEVVFDLSNQWIYTSWDVRVSALPQAVANVINNPLYTGYRIDDADFIETVQSNYYLLELEKGASETTIKVSENGDILI